MELILTVGLLSILAAASFGVIFWQAKTYFHIEQRSEAMTQLTNTYMVIYKEVKKWKRGTIDIGSNYLASSSVALPEVTADFFYNSTNKTLSYNGGVILKDAVASFTWLDGKKIVTGTLTKQVNHGGTTQNIAAIKFVIHPRNK